MCVIVVLTCEGEVVQWWPEEGTRQTHPLVMGREWAQGEEQLCIAGIELISKSTSSVVSLHTPTPPHLAHLTPSHTHPPHTTECQP